MHYVPLGLTGIDVSAIAFGAGPVPELMTFDNIDTQIQVVHRAIEAGINWFDTAATYGDGRSESSLGRALREAGGIGKVHIATKVRLMPDDEGEIGTRVRASVEGSLKRLGVERVTLLQLHNSITARRGDEPTSVTPEDVLGSGGVLAAFRRLQEDGVVEHVGLTAIGQPDAMRRVIQSGEFDTIQVPYNVLNPSAGHAVTADFSETDYGNVIAECGRQNMGVLAIRVFAGGALAGHPPSQHTYKTKFFPMDLYRRDQRRCEAVQRVLPAGIDVKEAALRFVLSHPQVTAAIIGFSEPAHIDDAVGYLAAGHLPPEVLDELRVNAARRI